MGLVLLGSLAANANAETTHIVYRTDGVAADVDIVDGCTETTGTLIVSTTEEGDVVAGFYGVSADICDAVDDNGDPLSSGQFGFGFVDKKSNGLGSATTSGSFSTDINNDHFDPLTFEFSLELTGTGPTIVRTTHDIYNEPGALLTMSFDTSQHRAAKVSGTITVNGQPITLLDPILGAGVSGGIYVSH